MLELPTPGRIRPNTYVEEALAVRMDGYIELAHVGLPTGRPICVRVKPAHRGDFDSTRETHHKAVCGIARNLVDDLRIPVYVAGTSLHAVLLSRGAGISRDDMFMGGNLQAIVANFSARVTADAMSEPDLDDIDRPAFVAQAHATPTALEACNWILLRYLRNAQALERALAHEHNVPVSGRTQTEIRADLEALGVVSANLPGWRRFGTLLLPDGVTLCLDLRTVQNRVGFIFHGDTPIVED